MGGGVAVWTWIPAAQNAEYLLVSVNIFYFQRRMKYWGVLDTTVRHYLCCLAVCEYP